MKILFSNPPWWVKRYDFVGEDAPASAWFAGVRAGSRWPHTNPASSTPDNFIFGEYLCYPFFMGHAATYVAKAAGAEVVFRDSIALRESYRSYYDHVREGRYDLIFVETATPCWDHDREVVRRIKEISPHSKIVIAGALAAKGEEVMNDAPIHAVLRGEYEKNAVKVVEGAEGYIDFDLLTVEEMNAAPPPYFDDVIAHRYFDCNPMGQRAPQLQLWTSRGCPYKCIFCVWPATMTGNDPDGTGKRTVRFYSPDHIEGTLRDLVGRYGYKSIYFDDDTFNLGDKHVLGICEVMSRIGVPWSAMCRADTIKTDTWRMMRESGCFGVKIGFESGNQWVVDNIVNKRLDLEVARETVHELKRLGMSVHGTFTYGLPGETREQMADTKRYLDSLPLDTYQEAGCGEIEGTPLATLRERGHLDRYQGASTDDAYLVVSDGGEKMRRLNAEAEAGVYKTKSVSDFARRERDALARAVTATTGPAAVWGIGTDFMETLGAHPEFARRIESGEVRLVDGKLAGQRLGALTIEAPSALAGFAGPVFLAAHALSSRNAMRRDAERLGVPPTDLRDVFETV